MHKTDIYNGTHASFRAAPHVQESYHVQEPVGLYSNTDEIDLEADEDEEEDKDGAHAQKTGGALPSRVELVGQDDAGISHSRA